jgi:hypothetical protein
VLGLSLTLDPTYNRSGKIFGKISANLHDRVPWPVLNGSVSFPAYWSPRLGILLTQQGAHSSSGPACRLADNPPPPSSG